jgi:hypothetical protein
MNQLADVDLFSIMKRQARAFRTDGRAGARRQHLGRKADIMMRNSLHPG